MVTEYTEYIWQQIENTVRTCERHLRRGVLPKHVVAWLPYSRAEGSLRRDMSGMWKAGRLVRCGRAGSRRGYRVPTEDERTLFSWVPSSVGASGGVVTVDDLAARFRQDVEMVRSVCQWLEDVGRIVKVAGGYRTPSAVERLAFRRVGMWPYGVGVAS